MARPDQPRAKHPPTPEGIIAALEAATDASVAAVRESRARARRLWIALGVFVVGVALLYWHQSGVNGKVDAAQARTKCVVDYLQKAADNSLTFYVSEWNKVNGQIQGFEQLRAASLAKDPAGVLAGFDSFLNATKAYRDGRVKDKLAFYGIEVRRHQNGELYLDTSHASAKAPCR